jgi:hypothetical protein
MTLGAYPTGWDMWVHPTSQPSHSIPDVPYSWDYLDVLGLMGRQQYIDIGDELIQLIVFNFTEYLTSTLCINLPFGYPALDLLS